MIQISNFQFLPLSGLSVVFPFFSFFELSRSIIIRRAALFFFLFLIHWIEYLLIFLQDIVRRHSFSGDYSNLNDLVAYSRMRNESSMSGEENRGLQKLSANGSGTNHVVGIPGVFNCRFSNPYVAAMQKRKRKKPTSFVPPPSIGQNNGGGGSSSLNNIADSLGLANEDGSIPRSNNNNNNNNNGYNSVPFWCRPLPSQYSQQVVYSSLLQLRYFHLTICPIFSKFATDKRKRVETSRLIFEKNVENFPIVLHLAPPEKIVTCHELNWNIQFMLCFKSLQDSRKFRCAC